MWTIGLTQLGGTLALGLLIGAAAQLGLPARWRLGWGLSVLVAASGACLASFVGQVAGLFRAGDRLAWLSAVAGALLLLLAVARLRGPDEVP